MGTRVEKVANSGHRGRYWVPILGSSIQVLEALADAQSQLTLHQVNTLAGVGKSSAFRILFTLQRLGYVEKDAANGRYRLGLKVLELARSANSERDLATVARPYLLELRDQFGETTNLAVLNQGVMVYVEIVQSQNAFRMAAAVGSRAPLHSTAVGKSSAAFLPRSKTSELLKGYAFRRFTPYTITNRRRFLEALRKVKELGHSYDEEETELGASCIGVPLLNADGIAVGAISVSGPTLRMAKQRKQIIAALRSVSARISGSAGLAKRTARKLLALDR